MPSHRWTPFPVERLPEPARSFSRQVAAALGCDVALVALPVLSTMAAAIGNSHRIRLTPDWTEPSVLWTSSVSESGTQKSPAILHATAPLQRREELALTGGQAMRRVSDDRPAGEPLPLGALMPGAVATAPPPSAGEPYGERYLVDDITIESLAQRLEESPYGLLLATDELAPWLRTASRGASAAKWVRVYGAGPIHLDRKTGNVRLLIPHAACGVTGGVQPALLEELFSRRAFEVGLAARLLLAHPPRRPRVWTGSRVDPLVHAAYDRMIGRLLDLRRRKPDGRAEPIDIRMSDEALRIWIEFFDRHGRRQYQACGDEAAMLAKIEGVAARIALVSYCARSVGEEAATLSLRVDAASVEAGIGLAEWFAAENLRVYGEIHQSPEARERAELIGWIERRGGRITVRDAQLGPRRLREDAETARRALDDLARRGLGRWEEVGPGERGGRGTWQLVLATATEPWDPGSTPGDVSPPPTPAEEDGT